MRRRALPGFLESNHAADELERNLFQSKAPIIMHMPDNSYLCLASPMHRLTEPAIRAAISALAIDLHPLGGGHGLDAACGNGDHSLWLAQTLPPSGRVTGIDICREGLLQASASSERAGLADNLPCIRGDLLRLPFLDRTFD